ncbi:hypothetical protein BB558_000644 [Smittium angustum]|uniref:RNase H type-1 domain-containing protein n=1 Tax=Smittium angustum TaxID=133377 RepID=A0A2U1JDL3_SMIAN|nr:hypothetical protein BB558_000644 [Smittium angustum]
MSLKVPSQKVRDIRREITKLIESEKCSLTEKHSTIIDKGLGIISRNNSSSSREFALVEGSVHSLEWQELSTRDAGIGNIYLSRVPENTLNSQSVVSGTLTRVNLPAEHLFAMRFLDNTNASNKNYGITIGEKNITGKWKEEEANYPINVKEFLAIFKALQLKEIMGLSVLIFSDNNSAIAYIRKFGGTSAQSSQRPIQISSPIRMEDSQIYIQQYPEKIWSALSGYVCNEKEYSTKNLCKLVQGPPSSKNQCIQSSLEHMEKYLQLPALELNTESNTKGEKRKGNNNVDSTPLEIRNMVSGSSGDGNTATNTDTIIKSTTRKQKRKFGSEQKQELDAISMENKRIRLNYLCPVKAYIAYKQRVAYDECKRSHTKNKKITIYSLFRKIRNHSKHVGSEWISNSIKSVIKLLKIPKGQKTPKARALGSTKAIRAGANLNDILTQGFWPSQSIFDTFYNLEHRANENFTEIILANQDSEATLSVSQSEVQ